MKNVELYEITWVLDQTKLFYGAHLREKYFINN